MIKKFNDFFTSNINEAVDNNSNTVDFLSDKASVSDDKFLKKISIIVYNALSKAGLGTFIVDTNIVYIDGIPGVLFHTYDNSISLVCCRNQYKKVIVLFNEIEMNGRCNSVASYSTDKLGFKDMIEQVILDIQSNMSNAVSEAAAPKGWRAVLKYGINDIAKFSKMIDDDRKYMYELLEKKSANQAKNDIWGQFMGGTEPGKTIVTAMGGKETNARFACFIANDAISDTYSDIDEMVALNDDYKHLVKGASGPAISVSGPKTFDLTEEDEAADRAAKRAAQEEAAIAEDLEKYKDDLRRYKKMVGAMADYIQKYGKKSYGGKARTSMDDLTIVGNLKGTRCLVITGEKGVGKSNAINEIIEEKNLVENRDYINITSGSSVAEAIYSYLYRYNGKIIIFDDTPDLFSTQRKMALWKAAFQDGPGHSGKVPAEVTYGRDMKDNGGDNGFYEPKKAGLTRQQKYFLEIGSKSQTERAEYYTRRRKELLKEMGKDYDKTTANQIMDGEWEEIEENTQPLMPKSFVFTGFVIIISNDTREDLQSAGKGHWAAIVDRAKNFDLSPKCESIWAMIKEKILAEYSESPSKLPDFLCIIPRKYTEEFIDEVDSLIKQTQYKNMSWRVINKFHAILATDESAADWKKDLREEMNINLK